MPENAHSNYISQTNFKEKMMFKKLASLASLAVLLLALSCTEKKEEKTENTVYPITTPYKTNAEITKDYVAQIQSAKNIEIRAQEKGFLQKIYVDEGQFVHAGQAMFQIMPQILQAEVMKAKAEVDQSIIELENATKLATNNVVSRNEQKMAKAKLDGARAELKLAQTKLSFTTIRAPFSGIINRIPLKLGSLVDEGDLLTSLSDNAGVYAYFNLSEPEYLNYQTHLTERGDQQVALVMANGEMFPEKGIIQNIGGEFDNETGNIAFRAKFPNPNQLLRNGETGKIKMRLPLYNILEIPQKSTYEIQDKKYVFVIDKNGIAKSREITVAQELEDVYILASGLKENEKFVVDGIQKLKDNQKVKVKMQNPELVMKSLKFKAN